MKQPNKAFIKPNKIFDQPLEKEGQTTILEKAKSYQDEDDFTVNVEPEDNTTSGKIETELFRTVQPKASKKLFPFAISLFVGLVIWQAIDSIWSSFQASDMLTLSWSMFVMFLSFIGLSAVGREWLKLRKLRQHMSIQEQGVQIASSDSIGSGKKFCQNLASQAGIDVNSASYQRWIQALTHSHNDREILELYDTMVVSEQDKIAVRTVSKFSTESAALIAISPLAIADMFLVAWRSIKMLDSLADIYGVELGYWSRVKLFKAVLFNMAMAGVSDLAVDASIDLLSMDLAGKVSTRAAQGFGVGILTARLGIRAMDLLRPLKWQDGHEVKLSSIRKVIAEKVISLVGK
ncbi:TIGR01620 family protein [Vibrio caribbeanicus]|uniref:YcjF family protein n=1 Tax=Vibrio caribbeanicus TaxID=701175 RepID=UPI0030D9F8D9